MRPLCLSKGSSSLHLPTALLLSCVLLHPPQPAAAATTTNTDPAVCVAPDGPAVATAPSASACPPGTLSLTAVGVNIFDALWDGWDPNQPPVGPMPPVPDNLTSSLRALDDARAYNFTLVRMFASPYRWFARDWRNLTAAEVDAYFAPVDAVVARAELLGLRLVPSLGYGSSGSGPSNPARLTNETYRDLITQPTSSVRQMLFKYAHDFVTRYAASPAILMWELGNELNLEADLCPDAHSGRTAGDVFSTSEAMVFLQDYRAAVRAADHRQRLVNTGVSSPRPASYHMMTQPCGSPDYWTPDSSNETAAMLRLYAANQDLLSMHFYGCVDGAVYTFCNGSTDMSLFALAQSVARETATPLYVGEFGAGNHGPNDGYNATGSAGAMYAAAAAGAIAALRIPLASLWAWECPSHGDTPNWCLHPGIPSHQNSTYLFTLDLQKANMQLAEGSAWLLNNTASLVMLDADAKLRSRGQGRQRRQRSGPAPACLDGSPYGVYVRLGARRDAWVVELQGGGWAYTLEDAIERATSPFGSSLQWNPVVATVDFGPRFADWSRVHLPYCDGSSFTGQVEEPVPAPGAPNGTLLFRGHANLRGALAEIRRRYLNDGQLPVRELIVTGGSAGGLSTIIHVDEIKALLNAEAVVGMPVAGFFLDHNTSCNATIGKSCNYTALMQNMAHLYNSSGGVNQACRQAHSADDWWRCTLAPTAAPFARSPLFFLQSMYDHWQLLEEGGIACIGQQNFNPPWLPAPQCTPAETAAVQAYGASLLAAFERAVLQPAAGRGRAAYLSSCVRHGLDMRYMSQAPAASPMTAFALWYYYRTVSPSIAPNDFRWLETLPLPRTDNPVGCPPYLFQH